MTSDASSSTIKAINSSLITSTSPIVTMEARPWSNPRVVQILAPLHPLLKHLERWLPKFNPDDGLLVEEHIHNYMLAINLNEVDEEDVVVRLFPYTLTRSTGSWYFSLSTNFITSWDIFEEQILTKFGDACSITSLINDLSNLKTNSKEKIKYFNSIFNKLLNEISATSRPVVDVQIECYISSLPSNIGIFVDRVNKNTLVENMKESMYVEKWIF